MADRAQCAVAELVVRRKSENIPSLEDAEREYTPKCSPNPLAEGQGGEDSGIRKTLLEKRRSTPGVSVWLGLKGTTN
jgi:hypothetical protein